LLGAQGIKQVLKNTGEYALEEITGLPNPKDVADLVKTGKQAVKHIDDTVQATGKAVPQTKINWPANNGFKGVVAKKVLRQGEIVDRLGDAERGLFVSPDGTPFPQRSLPANYQTQKTYHRYKILQPIEVESGEIAPYFGQPGGGIQYKFNDETDILWLLRKGYIEEIFD
jgi:hypothetical protein